MVCGPVQAHSGQGRPPWLVVHRRPVDENQAAFGDDVDDLGGALQRLDGVPARGVCAEGLAGAGFQVHRLSQAGPPGQQEPLAAALCPDQGQPDLSGDASTWAIHADV
jgi:hypothetical protein